MSNQTKVNKIFNVKRKITDNVIRQGFISGGHLALADKLLEANWDSRSLLAAPVMIIEGGNIADTHWDIFGALRDVTISAQTLWKKADKSLKICVKMTDVSIFTFPSPGNVSLWLDRRELDVSYHHVHTEGAQPTEVSWEEAKEQFGVRDFALRCLLVPKDHQTVSLTVAAAPYSKEELQERIGNNYQGNAIPHISLQVYPQAHSGARSGRSVLASMTRQEQEQDGFGFGVIPWCDVTADGEEKATVPDAEDLREATLRFMRSSMMLANATTAALYDVRIAAIPPSLCSMIPRQGTL